MTVKSVQIIGTRVIRSTDQKRVERVFERIAKAIGAFYKATFYVFLRNKHKREVSRYLLVAIADHELVDLLQCQWNIAVERRCLRFIRHKLSKV